MNIYSPHYNDPEYEHDVTKLSNQALEQRIVFIRNISKQQNISYNTVKELDQYFKKYLKEWERRRLETNNNNN